MARVIGDGETFVAKEGPEPVGAYPHARRVGNLLFVSGLGPRVRGEKEIPGVVKDASGKVVSHDIVHQANAVFGNLKMVVEGAGAKWEDIVDVTVFLVDMEGDFAAYNRVYAEWFRHAPTRTTVEVTALPTTIHIEVKAIARIG